MSLIIDNSFDSEGVQFSSGPTSRTTTGQFTKMSVEEKIAQLFKGSLQEKDEEIRKLKEQNEELRKENERLKQQSPEHAISIKKAVELKKHLDSFLGEVHTRPMTSRTTMNTYPLPVVIPNPDVNKPPTSASESSKGLRSGPAGPADDLSNSNHGFYGQEEFGARQEFRPESDADIVSAATETRNYHHIDMKQGLHNGHGGHNHAYSGHSTHHNLPSLANSPHSQRRFNNSNGTNNNNNRIRNNNYNNNNNNNINNNNNSKTIFIAWEGEMTLDDLRNLFDPADIADIRYASQKQFAHVDLKTDFALNKALSLSGQIKNEKQGRLRVEQGKPRSNNNNTTENGQRPQNQNKNHRQNNNKNVNNYNNNNPQQKKFYNNHHNNNNNHGGPQFTPNFPSDEKENNNNNNNWSYTQEHAKQNVDTV